MNYWIYLSIFAAAIAIFSMINILMNQMSFNKKMIWFAIVTLIPIIGPLIYLIRRNAYLGSDT